MLQVRAVQAHGHRHQHHQVHHQRRDGQHRRQRRRLADADVVERAEHDQRAARCGRDGVRQPGQFGRHVLEPAHRRDRAGQEVVDADQHAADAADERTERVRRDRHHAAPVGIARRHVDVLERQEDESDAGRQHERRRGRRGGATQLPEQEARHVVDRRADVGEHDRPGQQRAQASRRLLPLEQRLRDLGEPLKPGARARRRRRDDDRRLRRRSSLTTHRSPRAPARAARAAAP